MTAGVYCITNVVTGDRYIGMTSNIDQRLDRHKRQLSNLSHPNKKLQKLWMNHGADSLVFEVLEECEDNLHLLFAREGMWMHKLQPSLNTIFRRMSTIQRHEREYSQVRSTVNI
jgi:group I intron endonuclease